MALAAKVRVGHWEGSMRNGRAERMLEELEEATRRTKHWDRLARWQDWCHNAYIKRLVEAKKEAEDKGVKGDEICEVITGKSKREWEPKDAQKAKQTFQKVVYGRLMSFERGDRLERVRQKLGRWRYEGRGSGRVDRKQAEKVVRNLDKVAQVVPPRVMATVC